jgi:ubiquinone/menaquinone biosynthesis C-methylase UbiE
VDGADAERERAELIESWERVAPRWERVAQRVRDTGMPASRWMLDQLHLQPGYRVLELAAGPGDTGFLAAELIRPGGTLICSDAAGAMLEVARRRAQALRVTNVEFKLVQMEWIDLPTASVDAVLCRWGLMLTLDPAAAAREARRVLRPGGRIALAVWDAPEHNAWATVAQRALVDLGYIQAVPAGGPGMFALASAPELSEVLEDVGFTEVLVDAVELPRRYGDLDAYLSESAELSRTFGQNWDQFDAGERARVRERVAELVAPFVGPAGIELSGRSLVAAATA